MDGRGYLNRKVKLQIYNFVISACSYGFLWVRSRWAIANNENSNHFIQIMILGILSWRAGKEITGLMFGCSVCSLVYYYVEMLFCPIPIKIVSFMHALSIWMINECLCIGNTKYLKILWDYYFIYYVKCIILRLIMLTRPIAFFCLYTKWWKIINELANKGFYLYKIYINFASNIFLPTVLSKESLIIVKSTADCIETFAIDK